MVKVTTSINIDSEKRELAKKRGLILSDVLDQALDIALGIELKESTNLVNDKEELEQNLTILENEKDKFLKQNEKQINNLEVEKDKALNSYVKDYEKQVKTLENEKDKFLKQNEKQVKTLENEKDKFLKKYLNDHDNKLHSLEADKEIYLKNYEAKVSAIDFKIKNIDKALESAVIEDKEKEKQKDYNYLLRLAYKYGGALASYEQREVIDDFVDKYDLSTDEYRELINNLNNDLNKEYANIALGRGRSV